MIILKGCTRCGGDLHEQGQRDGDPEWACIQCGFRPVTVSREVRTEWPQGSKTKQYIPTGKTGRRDRGKGRKDGRSSKRRIANSQ